MKKKSILRKLKTYMIAFGVLMGFAFPVYASFFVSWNDGAFLYFFIGSVFAGITVGLVSYLFVRVILIRQLDNISLQAMAIKNGDFSENIIVESDDSVGLIIDGLNAAVLSIRNLFSRIHSLFELSDAALNKVGNSQSERVSIGQILFFLDQVTETSHRIIELSRNMIDSLHREQLRIKDSSEKFRRTLIQMDEFNQSMGSLAQRSEKISEIVEIIESITSKTNLLSLNASIEAARAGENGKSFAVVAGEIRNLASSTSDSAHRISDYISLIQQDVDLARRSVGSLSEGVNDNNRSIQELLVNFEQIVDGGQKNVNENKRLSSSISQLNNSFSEIEKVFDELSHNIASLKDITINQN